MKVIERIPFRLIVMECCGHQLCWINPRLPNHCPECGKTVYPAVKSWITFKDDAAVLRYHTVDHEHAYVPNSAFPTEKIVIGE
jgi:hypothetical protein